MRISFKEKWRTNQWNCLLKKKAGDLNFSLSSIVGALKYENEKLIEKVSHLKRWLKSLPMGKEILETCWVNKEVFSITKLFSLVVTMTIWAPCKPSSSMHLWTMEVKSRAYHFLNIRGSPVPGEPCFCFAPYTHFSSFRGPSSSLLSWLLHLYRWRVYQVDGFFFPSSRLKLCCSLFVWPLAFWFLICSSILLSICSSSSWLIFPFISAFGAADDDNPLFDPFSFLFDDPLDQSVTRCDLIPLQAAIDHHKTLSTIRQLCLIRSRLFSFVFITRQWPVLQLSPWIFSDWRQKREIISDSIGYKISFLRNTC